MSLKYTKYNIVRGAIIYSIGDTIAAIILDEFSVFRVLGIVFIGATIYALEIPNYFSWIDKKTKHLSGYKATLSRTALAVLYFNPLWIARHLLFIKLFSRHFNDVGWSLLQVAFWSFLVNIPISFLANYFIQNKVHLDWRFLASAIFSSVMAIYYALSETIFI